MASTTSLPVILCLLVLVRGLALMCIMPPGEAWDEYQHVAYVHELASGRPAPVLNRTAVAQQVVQAAVSNPMSEAASQHLGSHGATSYEDYWRGERGEADPRAEPVQLYQAQHAPLWYAMALPVYRLAGGVENWSATIASLRFMNLLLLVASAGVIFLTIRQLLPSRGFETMACVAVAMSPMMLLNSVRAANDSLAVLAIAGGFYCLARAMGSRAIHWTIASAVMAAAAVWCKTTGIAMLPFGVAVLLVCGRGTLQSRAVSAGLFLLIALAILSPYLLQSCATYGVLIPAQESVRIREAGHGLSEQIDAASSIDWWRHISWWWAPGTLWLGGWSFIRPPKFWSGVYSLTIAAGVVCWTISLVSGRARRRGEEIVSWRAGAFCALALVCFTAALGAHAVSSKVAWGAVTTNAWYASGAIPMLLVLVISGFARLLPFRAAMGMTITILGLYVLVEWIGLLGRMPAEYAQAELWNGGLQRLAELQPGLLGPATLMTALAVQVGICGVLVVGMYRCRRTPATIMHRQQ